jgi:hypothetical protein
MTDDERIAIRLAAAHYRWPAVRDAEVREQLGMTPTRFWQVVGALIVRADVVAEMPVECARLRRLHESRRRERCSFVAPST